MAQNPNGDDSLLNTVARQLGRAVGKIAVVKHVAGNREDSRADSPTPESEGEHSGRPRPSRKKKTRHRRTATRSAKISGRSNHAGRVKTKKRDTKKRAAAHPPPPLAPCAP